ncbi:MAG: hypothetical protein H6557_10760 [Lewinellaceae bacterium]|nr:hypothetical protein [Phaeodactylibacter sp.]MCB9037089.1 hypothetical protein [Lewinellaceae bacterium]
MIAVAEFKSQVGSFGNNFNNRTEEALGSAVDLWTAFREAAFPNQQAPWLGCLLVLERTEKSTSEVRLNTPHHPVFSDFENETIPYQVPVENQSSSSFSRCRSCLVFSKASRLRKYSPSSSGSCSQE